MTFGCKELVKRLMKGVSEQKPALPRTLPRYKNTWDVNIVLKELKTWIPTEELTLKGLTYKLCILIALLSGQRCQTIEALHITPDAMQQVRGYEDCLPHDSSFSSTAAFSPQ